MSETPNSPRRGRGGRASTLLAIALVGVLIGVAVDRYSLSGGTLSWPPGAALPTLPGVPRIGPIAAPDGTPPSGTPSRQLSSDPTEQAIQQVIQKGDDEQAQAVASHDMSVMADTSTSDFYQEQARTTQDLLDNGVTAIKLLGIDWGPISVNGTTATATCWETWSTTYSDGTTDQSRDRNVYTLVQDSSGAWKVRADDHPDENAGGGPGTSPGNPAPAPGSSGPAPSTPVPVPRSPRGRDQSQNWAGYAATGGSFTAVSGTWRVPQFSPDSTAGADATWVGIGGVDSRDLIQAGTQQTVTGNGATHYETWVETLPQASHPVPLVVSPGDSITISITASPDAQDQWQVAFKNNTSGQSYQVTEHYQSSLSSAEWIEESPSTMRGRLLPLDNFGQVDFSNATATKDGQQVSIADAGGQAITMITRGGQPLVQPSALGTDGSSFSVTRTSVPAPAPGQGGRSFGRGGGRPTPSSPGS